MERLQWVDIYKGLAIVLVVVGHSTGLFNPYIYQFHMAAFFFISGYTSHLERKGLLDTVVRKGYSIYLPYFVMFAVAVLAVSILQVLGVYSSLFKAEFHDWSFLFSEFFQHRIHINVLGAFWFLIALFGINVLQKAILFVSRDRVGIAHGLLSVIFLVAGYSVVNEKVYVPDNLFYLIFIGQFYFFLGIVLSRAGLLANLLQAKWLAPVLLVVNVALFYCFAWVWPGTVDYPSRTFGNILTNVLAAANGIVFLTIVSQLVARIPNKAASQVFVSLGQMTLGILVFHFMFFKISYAILASVGLADWTQLSELTPLPDVGNAYWWLISSVSLGLSFLTWWAILRVKALRIALGQDRDAATQVATFLRLERADEAVVKTRDRFYDLWKSAFSNLLEKHRTLVWLGVALLVLTIVSWWQQGIVVNDELQAQQWGQRGWAAFWDRYLASWSAQGRSLGAFLNNVAMFVGFQSDNLAYSRLVAIGSLFTVFGLAASLVSRVTRASGIGPVVFCVLVLLLPVSFEHTLPNAFVTLFCLPLSLALLCFHSFVTYLRHPSRVRLIVLCAVWFFFLTGYEAFIMLTSVFVILAWMEGRRNGLAPFQALSKSLVPIGTTIAFVVVYFTVNFFTPSSYAGNSFAKFDLGSSWAIVSQLFASGVPGYYLSNPKYQYLFTIYSQSAQFSGAPLSAGPLALLFSPLLPNRSDFLSNLVVSLGDPRVLLILLLGGVIVWMLGQSRPANVVPSIRLRTGSVAVLTLLLCALAMAVPNSLGTLYQGNVNANNFSALPVTFMIYVFIVIALVVILWTVLERLPRHWTVVAGWLLLLGLILPVQAMNNVFSQQQWKNQTRLTMLDALLDTNVVKKLESKKVLAPDFYETQNALGIHATYWTEEAQARGLDLSIVSKSASPLPTMRVLSAQQVVLLEPARIVLFSLVPLDGRNLSYVDAEQNQLRLVKLEKPQRDHLFYVYSFSIEALSSAETVNIDKNAIAPVVLPDTERIGSSLTSAVMVSGLDNDRWATSTVEIKIRTGKTGKLTLKGTVPAPFQLPANASIKVFADNNEVGDFPASAKMVLSLPIGGASERVVTLRLVTNWTFSAPPDVRKLCYILTDLRGE